MDAGSELPSELEQLEQLYYSDYHQSSLLGTVLNLANGTCGVGALAHHQRAR